MDRIERILNTEWNAEKSDADRNSLRKAFENHELHTEDRPVLVTKLSGNAVDDIFDVLVNFEMEAVGKTKLEATEGSVLAHGKSWVLFADADAVNEVLKDAEYLEDKRISNVDFPNFDPSDAQIDFVEKSVKRGIRVMETKLQSALDGAAVS